VFTAEKLANNYDQYLIFDPFIYAPLRGKASKSWILEIRFGGGERISTYYLCQGKTVINSRFLIFGSTGGTAANPVPTAGSHVCPGNR
jgi:hypothetical protein